MAMTKMADLHDLVAAERFLAAEARIAGTFGRIEEAVAPLLRGMRARDRTTCVVDAERGALLGHAFLRPPYAPGAEAEWFVATASKTCGRACSTRSKRSSATTTP